MSCLYWPMEEAQSLGDDQITVYAVAGCLVSVDGKPDPTDRCSRQDAGGSERETPE